MFAKILLIVTGAIFLCYGVLCWLNPELPAEVSGLFIASQDGYAEMAAMYGGLQSSFGVVLLAAAFIKAYLRPALWLLFITIGTLAIARGSVALSDLDSTLNVARSSLDIGMNSSLTTYTWAALAFESTVALLASVALIKSR